MNMRFFLRMARFARHPPSDARVKLIFGVVALVLAIGGIEYFIGWPEWMQMDPQNARNRLP